MAQNELFLIEGEIDFVDVPSPIFDATIYVRLLDMSWADAPSKVIAEEVIPNISIKAIRPSSIPFSMRIPELDKSLMYTLSAYINVNGKEEITDGDYITMESFPVTSIDLPVHMHLKVCQVK